MKSIHSVINARIYCVYANEKNEVKFCPSSNNSWRSNVRNVIKHSALPKSKEVILNNYLFKQCLI